MRRLQLQGEFTSLFWGDFRDKNEVVRSDYDF